MPAGTEIETDNLWGR